MENREVSQEKVEKREPITHHIYRDYGGYLCGVDGAGKEVEQLPGDVGCLKCLNLLVKSVNQLEKSLFNFMFDNGILVGADNQ